MMRSLFSGVSGLKNHQTRMDVIGNNISNVNTTGYKSSRAMFSDMLSQTLTGAAAPIGNIGGVNPKQIGLGSSLASISMIFTDGSVQSTGKNTDLCLSSDNSLFILNMGGNGTAYTRNGAFEFDADGNYVQAGNGYFVQGWMADENGTLDTTGAVGTITIPSGKPFAPKASTIANYSLNLNSETPTITALSNGAQSGTASTTAPITATMSNGEKITLTSGTYKVGESLPVVTTLSVYDTLGTMHELPVYFTLIDAATNKWAVSLDTTNKTQGQTSKTQHFDSATGQMVDGILEKDGTTTLVEMPVIELVFDKLGAYDQSQGGPPQLQLANGSQTPQNVTLDFSKMTQYANESTVAGKADGYAAGTLKTVNVDTNGIITGTYTNGLKRSEAQIALQRFTNPAGLEKVGDSLYQESNNCGLSGSPNTVSAMGAKLTPSALEMSNVDVANEFTDMIVTQRGFQANSKIITVSDEMLELLMNLKR